MPRGLQTGSQGTKMERAAAPKRPPNDLGRPWRAQPRTFSKRSPGLLLNRGAPGGPIKTKVERAAAPKACAEWPEQPPENHHLVKLFIGVLQFQSKCCAAISEGDVSYF